MRSISAFLIISIFTLLSIGCNNATNNSSASSTNSMTTAATQANVAPKTPATKKAAGVTVAAKKTEAKSGEDVCVDIQVKGFEGVVSMQYSFNWDPTILKYKEVKGFNLKDLSVGNFGVHVVKEGKMTFSWYDQAVKGITLADNSTIHQICYTAEGKSGSKGKIQITQDPIIVEITGNDGQQKKFFTETGYVKLK